MNYTNLLDFRPSTRQGPASYTVCHADTTLPSTDYFGSADYDDYGTTRRTFQTLCTLACPLVQDSATTRTYATVKLTGA